VLIKNFDEKWDENNLIEIFGKYGKIKTIYIREDHQLELHPLQRPEDKDAILHITSHIRRQLKSRMPSNTGCFVDNIRSQS
jgi:hypothetical protein